MTFANLLLVVAFLLCSEPSMAYVNKKTALPLPRQLQFLKQVTTEIVDSPTGGLSDAMIAESHHVMRGWSTAPTRGSAENAVAIENLVKRLVDERKATGNMNANPTTADYNALLESWARSDAGVFAAERCEQILAQMQMAGVEQVRPNLASFKVVIMAWKHAGGPSLSSFRAQRILEWMVSLYQEGQNSDALPDSDCFNAVLQSWSRNTHKMAPVYAENLLGIMERLSQATESTAKLRPETTSFNAVLLAWTRSKDPKAWKRLCEVLEFMEKLRYVEGNTLVEPDRITYHIVMQALSSASKEDPNAASKADAILRSIEKRHKKGELFWEPDTILFNTASGCYAKSNTKNSYRKARSILDRQIHYWKEGCEECRPDVVSFTSVISSCATDQGNVAQRVKSFNVALSTYQQLLHNPNDYGAINHVTLGTMLRCVALLLPLGNPDRKRWTRKLFKEAVSRGLVGDMVVSKLREATTKEEYKSLMKGYTRSTLPSSWTRNVHEKNEHRRKVTATRKRAEV